MGVGKGCWSKRDWDTITVVQGRAERLLGGKIKRDRVKVKMFRLLTGGGGRGEDDVVGFGNPLVKWFLVFGSQLF